MKSVNIYVYISELYINFVAECNFICWITTDSTYCKQSIGHTIILFSVTCKIFDPMKTILWYIIIYFNPRSNYVVEAHKYLQSSCTKWELSFIMKWWNGLENMNTLWPLNYSIEIFPASKGLEIIIPDFVQIKYFHLNLCQLYS